MAVLVAVLSIGGLLSVVFSIRDQRRLSQLHELAVSSEVGSQRRTELSYSSFLEESQKTLTLVNQTLALAREATEQTAHTMERKAAASLASIEASARDLLEPILDKGVFQEVVEHSTRANLEAIANELRAIEGYLLLQDIELKPYSQFVKGMSQYLADDTAGALRTLRHAAQNQTVRELQLFSIYWDAKLNIALGHYDRAAHIFRMGEETLSQGSFERSEFDRMIIDSTFFVRAVGLEAASPLERFNAVAKLLVQLEEKRDGAGEDRELRNEYAQTRGDLLTWIAYRPGELFDPLPSDHVAAAEALAQAVPSSRDDGAIPIQVVVDRDLLADLSNDAIRAWALTQASVIYSRDVVVDGPEEADREVIVDGPEEADREVIVDGPEEAANELYLALAFGRAECAFMLGKDSLKDQIKAYKRVERKTIEDLGTHHEQRTTVELDQTALVCACRLLNLQARLLKSRENKDSPDNDNAILRGAEAEVKTAHRRVKDGLGEMRDRKIMLLSSLQRRPLSQTDFSDESLDLFNEAFRGRDG